MSLTAEQQAYVEANPGRVFRHRAKDLVVAVPLPPIAEDKEVTRERLLLAVHQTFLGARTALLEAFEDCCRTGELIVLETSLAGRDYGVVLHR